MSPDVALIVVGATLVVLLTLEAPVAAALAASGALGIWLLRGDEVLFAALGNEPYAASASYGLSVIPMYLLLGMFALHGRLADRAYELANRIFRRLPGGLGIATVGACAGFAAVSGSSVSTAATVGRISVTEMRRRGYPVGFAGAIVAMAGTLGILIPPSIVLALYGSLADESVGRLLLAGIVPGVLSACFYAGYIFIVAPRKLQRAVHEDLGEVLQSVAPVSTDIAPIEFTGFQLFRAGSWLVAIFGLVMVGIYTGQFTVIESGALAALLAMIMLVVETSPEGLKSVWRGIRDALSATVNTTAMTFFLVVGAAIFSFFLVLTRAPIRFSEWVTGVGLPPILVLCIVLLALLLMGTVLETISIVVITVPLLHPLALGLGFDGVVFAILFVKMIELGLVTPPVGMNVYIVSGVANVRAETIFKGVVPFIAVDLLLVALLIAFPEIILWLPDVMGQ